MLYSELPYKWKEKAKKLIKDSIDQWEDEIAKEQHREPIYYSMRSEIFRKELETRDFEIVTDEITKEKVLTLQ